MLRPSAREFIKINKKPSIILECGIWTGDNALNMYNEMNIDFMYLIDRWYQKYENYDFPEIKTFPQKVFDKFYDKNNVIIIRSDTLMASMFFHEEYFDYIYLDDNHSYDHVIHELELYYEKLNLGGMLCGDNYEMPAVKQAVDEFCNKIKNKKLETEQWKESGATDWWIWK
jgi:hypothetical protein